MKKHIFKKQVFLKILVALTVLSSILLSTLLGVSKAEYFKSLSKKFDFEASSDLNLEYILVDADDQNSATAGSTDRGSSTYHTKKGVYRNSESFVQPIVVGAKDAATIDETATFTGASIVYKIKIPVDETGYYSLDFSTYMLAGESGNEGTQFYTLSYTYCVGCEVVNAKDNITFDESAFSMPFRIFKGNSGRAAYSDEPLLYADSAVLGNSDTTNDSVYQWKTLCPSRSENVRLTFKVEEEDVNKGYVIWAWDFSGLEGKHTYRLFIDSLSIEKTMELDGTTKYRTSNDPYFMFPQTAYINNTVTTTNSTAGSGSGGRSGRSRISNGRATFVTEATANSLGMHAEMLYSDNGSGVDNPLGIYIPLKNVQKNTTYKVTFDFSVARQGTDGANPDVYNGYAGTYDWYSYDGAFSNIFIHNANPEKMFQSYLVSGLTTNKARTTSEHKAKQGQITYANKQYQGANIPLVKYDEMLKFNASYLGSNANKFPDYSTSDSINDTYSKEHLNGTYNGVAVDSTEMRNFFNAVQHTEYNGQNKINWITFYNTTFTFNIDDSSDVNDLYWVWAIDALRYTAYYNLRIDNVRIQEVVEYASELDNNGVRIGGTQIGTSHMCHWGQGTSGGVDQGVFNNYRGWNSTGQNYQARGYDETRYMIKGNIYAPIVDAAKFTVAQGNGSDYLIELDGRAVLDGGVNKYVFSVDGGITWQDMTFSGTDASSDDLINAEAGIDMRVQGQSYEDNFKNNKGYDRITFGTDDAANGNFEGWKLIADLSEYKHLANLDIIIAAVPEADTDLRCEILRIINFNQIRNYRTFLNNVISDIEVGTVGNPLNACVNVGGDNSENNDAFVPMRGWRYSTTSVNADSAKSGYCRMASGYSYAYEDIRTLYSDFPVKTKLSFAGWSIVDGGVDKYGWSVDNGKTWNDCYAGTPKNYEITNDYDDQKWYWYDGSEAFNNSENVNGDFTGALQIDLSAYVGQTVDVIFAAKPKQSDVYVPVAKIDNVAVYGDGSTDNPNDKGAFYSKFEVSLQQTAGADPIKVTPDETLNGEYFSGTSQWNLGFANNAYTIFEPYNVDILQTRKCNNEANKIINGGKVRIDGFTFCPGGVKEYKFTLNHGETWLNIHPTPGSSQLVGNVTNTDYIAAAQYSNSSFTAADGVNGDYHTNSKYIEFYLPALPTGQKDLLVVAVGNNEKLYPVLNITLDIVDPTSVGTDPTTFAFFSRDTRNGIRWGSEKRTDLNWTFIPGATSLDGVNAARYRFTLPVSETGVHTLSMNAELGYYPEAVTKSKTGVITQTWGTNRTEVGTGTVSMSVPKTHYLVGEDINVTYSANYTGSTSTNTLSEAAIGIVRLKTNSDGTKEPILYSGYPKFERFQFLKETPHNVAAGDGVKNGQNKIINDTVLTLNNGWTESLLEVGGKYEQTDGNFTHLPAGDYRLYFCNDIDIGVGNTIKKVGDIDYTHLQLTPPIDITIHDNKGAIAALPVHDYNCVTGEESESSYYNYIGSQITIDEAATDPRINTPIWVNNTAPFGTHSITLTYNVTKQDIKRGYVILDFNLTQLGANITYKFNLTNISFKKTG